MSPQYRQSVSDLTAKELNKEPSGAASGHLPTSSNNTNVNNVDPSSENGASKDAASAANDTTKLNTGKEGATAVPEDPNKEREEILKGLTTSFNSTVDCSTYYFPYQWQII